MITRFVQGYGLFCLLFLIMACNVNKGHSVQQQSQMNDTLVFTGCQEKISLKSGTFFELRLEAIQGTGYQWLLKEPCSLLEQLKADVIEFSTPENQEVMPGQAGYQILRFKAVSKGEVVINLEYRRTFEKQVEKRCVIKIVVE